MYYIVCKCRDICRDICYATYHTCLLLKPFDVSDDMVGKALIEGEQRA